MKVSRSVFYKIRSRAATESTAALHPRFRAPKQPARRYGPAVINELVRIRKQLKSDGWDYGPRTIYYEATIQETFPGGGKVPSLATIARLLSSVGQVERAPRKRPKSSYIPFSRASAMALWQLDAFEFRLANGQTATIYQLLDDATRYDVGTWACHREENSADAQQVLATAIDAHGAPREVLSDNSMAFNQLRQGTIGSVEIFLASNGAMLISGPPGKPTTQGKNERSHQTLQRFLEADRPGTLEQLQGRITRYRQHYNHRRPHQALNQSTPHTAWELLTHTPATEPLALEVLESKAAQYRQVRKLRGLELGRATVTMSKSGNIIDQDILGGKDAPQTANEMLVDVTEANRQVYYQGYQVGLPTTFGGRRFHRTITDDEFLLSDPDTSEIVFFFPLPMIALQMRGRWVASYAIQGVQLSHPTKQWARKEAAYREQFAQRQNQVPEVFSHGSVHGHQGS